eukprot:7002292-Heterocapsa_arctica.AAC.1
MASMFRIWGARSGLRQILTTMWSVYVSNLMDACRPAASSRRIQSRRAAETIEREGREVSASADLWPRGKQVLEPKWR